MSDLNISLLIYLCKKWLTSHFIFHVIYSSENYCIKQLQVKSAQQIFSQSTSSQMCNYILASSDSSRMAITIRILPISMSSKKHCRPFTSLTIREEKKTKHVGNITYLSNSSRVTILAEKLAPTCVQLTVKYSTIGEYNLLF